MSFNSELPGKFEMPGLLGFPRRCCSCRIWSKKRKPAFEVASLDWFCLISGCITQLHGLIVQLM